MALFSTKSVAILRSLHSRRMASMLINNPKYTFLQDLDIQPQNLGSFDGSWFANGEVRNFEYLTSQMCLLIVGCKKRKPRDGRNDS